eukprot:5811554-Amphidinium_carterae.1
MSGSLEDACQNQTYTVERKLPLVKQWMPTVTYELHLDMGIGSKIHVSCGRQLQKFNCCQWNWLARVQKPTT